MGAIAAALGGVLWVGCIFMLFFKFPAWLIKTVGGVFVFCFAAQMLTLLALNHSICNGEAADQLKINDQAYQCGLGPDAVTSIVAAIFYLGIGVTILVCPVPKTAVITCMDKCCKDVCVDDEEGGCGCCGEEASVGAVVKAGNSSPPGGEAGSIPGPIVNAPGVGGTSIPGSIDATSVEQPNSADTTVTETYNEDGSVTIKEERVDPTNGSLTVSITTRPAAPTSSV